MSPQNSRRLKWTAFIAVDVLLAVFIIGLLVVRNERLEARELNDLGVSLFPQAQPLAPFSLTDQHGNRFTEADLLGQWSLVFFGFSHCPNVCPLSLRELANAREELLAGQSSVVPQIVFATVDPARDDPARLRQYLEGYPGELIGLTGADAELARLASQLYVVASRGDSDVGAAAEHSHAAHEDAMEANVQAGFDHSGHVSVINPEGELVAAMQLPHRAENITAALARLAEE